MDVVRSKVKPSVKDLIVKYKRAILIVGALTFVSWVGLNLGDDLPEKDRQSIVIENVQQGSLKIDVDGYGTLRSNNQKLLTSYTAATVEEIVLRPGARVSEGSVVLKMSNPQIDQQLAIAKQQLESEQMELNQLQLNNEQTLNERVISVVQLESQLALAQLRKKAMHKLFEKGIVSELTYTEADLTAKQLEGHLELLRRSVESLKEVNAKKLEIQKKLIEQREIDFQTVLDTKDKLTVKAPEAGILQELYVELGQSVAPGEQLIMIGNREDLLGLLKIPQSKVGLVSIGQTATLKIGTGTVSAEVTRIDPAIEDSTVTVELTPTNTLPASARPNQRIDGTIHVNELANVLYVRKPANVRANSTQKVFVLNNEEKVATRTSVSFGEDSGQFIEVRTGLQAGQQVILSDMSNIANSEVVRIVF